MSCSRTQCSSSDKSQTTWTSQSHVHSTIEQLRSLCSGINMKTTFSGQNFWQDKSYDILTDITFVNRSMQNVFTRYSKTCVKRSLKNRQNKDLNDKW